MTGNPFDPMTDERSDREIRRFLEMEVEGIPGAPSRAEMVERLHRANRPGSVRQGFVRAAPGFRLVIVLGLIAALAAGVLAVGALLNQRTTIVVPPGSRTVMTVAGTEVGDAALELSVELPNSWSHDASSANPDTTDPSAQLGFFLSAVDNAYEDPCANIERSPKVGSSVAAVTNALAEIPGTTASTPLQVAFAGYEATQITLSIPSTLPCPVEQFSLWRDGRDATSSPKRPNEEIRVALMNVGGYRVAVASRTYPETGPEAKAVLQRTLDSMAFDSPPPLIRAGALQRGTYEMSAEFTGIPFTFTVPEGWTVREGWIESGDPWTGSGLAFGSYYVTHVYPDACSTLGTLGEVKTGQEVSNALAEQVGPQVSGPTAVSLGGLPATQFELSVAPEFDIAACDADLLHIWPDPGPDETGGFGMDPGQNATVHVLDRAGQNSEIVAIWNVDSPPARVVELQAMVRSVQFLP